MQVAVLMEQGEYVVYLKEIIIRFSLLGEKK